MNKLPHKHVFNFDYYQIRGNWTLSEINIVNSVSGDIIKKINIKNNDLKILRVKRRNNKETFMLTFCNKYDDAEDEENMVNYINSDEIVIYINRIIRLKKGRPLYADHLIIHLSRKEALELLIKVKNKINYYKSIDLGLREILRPNPLL